MMEEELLKDRLERYERIVNEMFTSTNILFPLIKLAKLHYNTDLRTAKARVDKMREKKLV